MAVIEFSTKGMASQTWRRLLATGARSTLRFRHGFRFESNFQRIKKREIEVLRLGPVLALAIRSDAVLGGCSNPLDFLQQ
jgi:hypothetical protein